MHVRLVKTENQNQMKGHYQKIPKIFVNEISRSTVCKTAQTAHKIKRFNCGSWKRQAG